MMHHSTQTAIVRLATKHDMTALIDGCTVKLTDGYGVVVHAVRLDSGRWANARYDERSCQWRSSDKPDAPQGYSYSFASRPEALDVRSYRSATDCLRSALRDTGMPNV